MNKLKQERRRLKQKRAADDPSERAEALENYVATETAFDNKLHTVAGFAAVRDEEGRQFVLAQNNWGSKDACVVRATASLDVDLRSC